MAEGTVFKSNTKTTQDVSQKIVKKVEAMSQTITRIESLAYAAADRWVNDYSDVVLGNMNTYLKNIRTKQETLAGNLETYLGVSVELSEAVETTVSDNAALFDD